jgi:hypothetical protein
MAARRSAHSKIINLRKIYNLRSLRSRPLKNQAICAAATNQSTNLARDFAGKSVNVSQLFHLAQSQPLRGPVIGFLQGPISESCQYFEPEYQGCRTSPPKTYFNDFGSLQLVAREHRQR